MRRRWPALAATIPLVLVWAAAIAHPASAAPLGVRPGGPVSSLSTPRQNTTVTSSNWAGYVAAGASGTFTSASANWTELHRLPRVPGIPLVRTRPFGL